MVLVATSMNDSSPPLRLRTTTTPGFIMCRAVSPFMEIRTVTRIPLPNFAPAVLYSARSGSGVLPPVGLWENKVVFHRRLPGHHLGIFLTVSILVLLAAVAAACSSDSPTATAIPPPPATATPVPAANLTLIPTSTVLSAQPTGAGLAGVALGFATELVEDLGSRESATEDELEAAEYLASTLKNFGYAVELQTFTIQRISRELSGLEIDAPEPRAIDSNTLVLSAIGEVSGNLVSVGLARDGDFPEGEVKGQIALAQRGSVLFEEMVTLAAEAGAVAVVIYNNVPGNFQGRLSNLASIPAVSISQNDGQELEDLLSIGAVEATVSVVVQELPSRNVVAEKAGPGDAVVVLGAHYDTVPNIAGANDNASGTAVLLTVAGELAGEDLPFTIRFIAFGSEELGLRGSRHYVTSLAETQLGRIRVMFNFDALGSGERLGILGTTELIDLAVEQGDAQDIFVEVTRGPQGASSDHQSFVDFGIPVLMFVSEDFSRIHTPADTLEFVEPSLLGGAAELAIALLRSDEFLAVLAEPR